MIIYGIHLNHISHANSLSWLHQDGLPISQQKVRFLLMPELDAEHDKAASRELARENRKGLEKLAGNGSNRESDIRKWIDSIPMSMPAPTDGLTETGDNDGRRRSHRTGLDEGRSAHDEPTTDADGGKRSNGHVARKDGFRPVTDARIQPTRPTWREYWPPDERERIWFTQGYWPATVPVNPKETVVERGALTLKSFSEVGLSKVKENTASPLLDLLEPLTMFEKLARMCPDYGPKAGGAGPRPEPDNRSESEVTPKVAYIKENGVILCSESVAEVRPRPSPEQKLEQRSLEPCGPDESALTLCSFKSMRSSFEQ